MTKLDEFAEKHQRKVSDLDMQLKVLSCMRRGMSDSEIMDKLKINEDQLSWYEMCIHQDSQ